MGIAEAIERVRRHARQAGLGAVIEGVGEQLRSNVIPTPLRGAAWRIASLLEAAVPNTTVEERTRDVLRSDRAAFQREAYKERELYELAREAANATSSAHAQTSSTAEFVPNVTRAAIREVSPTAADSGEAPPAPLDGEAVRAEDVGATPTFNATPESALPIDATPVDDAPADALNDVVLVEPVAASDDSSDGTSPSGDESGERAIAISGEAESSGEAEMAPAEVTSVGDDASVAPESEPAESEPAASERAPAERLEPESSAEAASKAAPAKPAKPRSKSGARKPSTPPSARSAPEPKEEVAASDEAAKTLARSDSRGAKKRPRAKADTSKKK